MSRSADVGNLDEINSEVQTGKTVQGGILHIGTFLLNKGLNTEELKQACRDAISALRQTHPDIQWFMIYMYDDMRMTDCALWVVRAEYKEGQMEIVGGNADKAKGPRPSDDDLSLAQVICTEKHKVDGLSSESEETWYKKVFDRAGVSHKKIPAYKNVLRYYQAYQW